MASGSGRGASHYHTIWVFSYSAIQDREGSAAKGKEKVKKTV